MNNKDLPYRQHHPFKVPEGYFESLEERILKSAASSERKEDSFEHVDSGFIVPDYYFERLEDRVMDKLQKPSKPTKVLSLFNKEAFYYAAGVAAVLIAIISTQLMQQPDTLSMKNVDMLTLEGYIDESIDISSPEISRIFAEGDFSFAPLEQSSYVAQEAVIDYLHEHIEEPSFVFNED